MKVVKLFINDSNFMENNKHYSIRGFFGKNSKSYLLILICIILILYFAIEFYQFKEISNQNKKIKNLLNNAEKQSDKKKSLINNYSNLKSLIKKNTNFYNNDRKIYFLEKLINKSFKQQNLKLLNNYIELDNLFINDERYDGARNCLVESEFNHSCIYNFLFPKKVVGKKRKLFGGKLPTSYVMLDDFDGIKVAYSFGIGKPKWYLSFDKELADRNIDVYMYDHTINKLAYDNPKFHFHEIGLAGKNNTNQKLKTLEDILKQNGDLKEKNMILKVDIENNEWEAFIDCPDYILKNFRFLLFEFHFDFPNLEIYSKVLSKLNKNHQIFYVHCVNCREVKQYGDIRICSALEVSYVIKEGYQFEDDDSIYPIEELNTICNTKNILDFNENIFKYFDNSIKH